MHKVGTDMNRPHCNHKQRGQPEENSVTLQCRAPSQEATVTPQRILRRFSLRLLGQQQIMKHNRDVLSPNPLHLRARHTEISPAVPFLILQETTGEMKI